MNASHNYLCHLICDVIISLIHDIRIINKEEKINVYTTDEKNLLHIFIVIKLHQVFQNT